MQGAGRGSSITGGVIVGLMMAHDIPRKLLADSIGMNESTLSRKINDEERLQPEDLLRIGMAIGKIQSKKAL
ncbi:MAG: hypothetical protein JWN14_31 [Chthonomonadales bacterium]|nr:hypothetical protein [Chthonomonadales bacterium]